MNDEELNELLARGDHEAQIFRDMDAKRDREALEAWRAAGNKGKPPLPLMQLEELPDIYQTDEPFQVPDEVEMFEGRGARKRAVVSYNDGLDDDTWAMVSCHFIFYLFDPRHATLLSSMCWIILSSSVILFASAAGSIAFSTSFELAHSLRHRHLRTVKIPLNSLSVRGRRRNVGLRTKP